MDEITMSTNKKYFSGNSIEQAVLQAARHFKLEASEVAYRQVERRHGFLRSRRRAVIEVDVDNPGGSAVSAEAAAPSSESIETAAPREHDVEIPAAPREVEETEPPLETPSASRSEVGPKGRMTTLPEKPARSRQPVNGAAGEAAREAVRRLCVLGQLDLEAEVFEGDDGLEVEVRGNGVIKHILEGETVLEYSKPQLDERDKHAKELSEASGTLMLSGGSISLQSESHPVEFRKVELMVLKD